MFIGEFTTQLGDKSRIAIPKKIRTQLNGKIYLTRGYDYCLMLIDEQNWEKLLKNINVRPLLNVNVRDTKRYILGGSVVIEPDSQGRFVIPESLKEFAQVTEKVTFIGTGEWVEIWDYEKWKNKLNNLTKEMDQIADRLIESNGT